MNTQKPEGHYDGEQFQLTEIFDTIQGEGPYSGRRATFVRLAGCNLQCVWCDTDYSVKRMASLEYILSQARMPLVVVTGGEPLRHANLVELVIALEKDGHVVQIETNGTIWNNELWEHTECMFVVSPKTTSIRKEYVSNRLCRVKFKQVMGEGAFPSQPNNKGGVPSIEPDYVMPLDSKDERGLTIHAKVCYDYVMNSDAILQLQIHKLIGAR